MNPKAVRIFKIFIKNEGCFRRQDDPLLWDSFEDEDVLCALDILKAELDFDIHRVGNRAYLIPNQENELFSQTNADFRRDIKASPDQKIIDLYLLNYLCVYLLYEFFHGEGSEPLTRDFILRDDFIELFTNHCKQVCSSELDVESSELEYGINFQKLAQIWLGKKYGDPDSRVFTNMTGCLNRIMIKLKQEGLFFVEDDKITPTQKAKDLMPYFLRRERVVTIHQYLEEHKDAAVQ